MKPIVRSGRSRFLSVALVLVALLSGVSQTVTAQGTTSPAIAAPAQTQTRLAEKFDGQKLYRSAFEAVRNNHILLADPSARQNWSNEWENKFYGSKQLATEKGTDEAILQMLQSLGQRFDYFFDRDATKAEQDEINASLVGIGVKLELKNAQDIIKSLPKGVTWAEVEKAMQISSDHELMVQETMEGGPAEKFLQSGDVITNVDGNALDGMLLKDAMSMIKGADKTEVAITVQRPDDQGKSTELTFKITRQKIAVKVVHMRDLGDRISYIKLDDFMSQHATAEMRDALTRAASGKGIILDLRGNPGGMVKTVLDIAMYMVPEGTIMVSNVREGDNVNEYTSIAQKDFILNLVNNDKDRNKKQVTLSERLELIVPENMPIVVLVDNGSASASEILSGVLQHAKRALVVGKPTRGKGVGQNEINLPFGRALHVTSFEFLPGGAKMDWIGIIPDVEVDQAADDDKTDNQLDTAISRIKELITNQEARGQEAPDLYKKNHEDFQKTLDQRDSKTKP